MWWAITRKELTQGSKVTNIKLLLTFLYTNYINQYTPRDTVGKGYGNLAANIAPTSEKPFTNTISNQSFNYSKESVLRQFRTSYASHGWEAVNNHVWPEEPMATHSSVLAWRIPGTGEPDGLPSMGSHRVGHD